MKRTPNLLLIAGILSLSILGSSTTRAALLIASNGQAGDSFGVAVSVSGTLGLMGADEANNDHGGVYLYGSLDTASGTTTQNALLLPSDAAADADNFGNSVSVSGNVGLVGAANENIGGNSAQGAVYLYGSLDTANGPTTEDAKLIASDGMAYDTFGSAVSVSGTLGLVGAGGANNGQGTAYVYTSLDTASDTTTQSAKLIASDGAAYDEFGGAVSVSGALGLVGAGGANNGQGAAYVYTSLDTASDTTTQSAKLIASDGAAYDEFGYSVSVSGNIGLVGAVEKNYGRGAAYVYTNLDTASGTTIQSAKLITTGSPAQLGSAVSVSGTTGLVGANDAEIKSNPHQGSAYLYLNVDTLSGTATQNVEIIASNGQESDYFGDSVSLNGDLFVIGAPGANARQGRSYSGTVSSMTTLDAGSASRTIDGISFISQDDWVIGQTTNANEVTLLAGNSASVTAVGKAVYIGKEAGSNDNRLIVQGSLAASAINVGSILGNTGNTLELDHTATITLAGGTIYLAPGNNLSIEGDYTNPTDLLSYLSEADASLGVWQGSSWETVNSTNYNGLISSSFENGFTAIVAVPEPSLYAFFVSMLMLLIAGTRGYRANVDAADVDVHVSAE